MRLIFITFLLTVAGISVNGSTQYQTFSALNDRLESRIVGGGYVLQNEFPFVVRLQMTIGTSDARYCGGSLISTRFVMTAANCLTGATNVKVKLGSVDDSNPQSTIDTFRYIQHPEYDVRTLSNNIGLVDLLTHIFISASLRPVLLPRSRDVSEPFAGLNATVVGWGAISQGGAQSRYLRFVDLKTISLTECRRVYGNLSDETLCAESSSATQAQGICNGDAGGPLFLRNVANEPLQIGIASFGSNAGCSARDPTGYVRPQHYWAWISDWTGMPIRN